MLFSEQNYRQGEYCGSIEVICGSMFSGKTEELLRRLKRAQIAKLNIEIFKPRTDTRYDETAVVSHDLNSIESTTCRKLNCNTTLKSRYSGCRH